MEQGFSGLAEGRICFVRLMGREMVVAMDSLVPPWLSARRRASLAFVAAAFFSSLFGRSSVLQCHCFPVSLSCQE